MTVTLVATSHGSAAPAARLAISGLVSAVREASPRHTVHEAFVDVQEPRVADVVRSTDGPVVVVPLLLTPGFHARVDIGRAVETPAAVASRTLGPDRRLVRLMVRRLTECGATKEDVLVLGAAGSTDAGALRSVDATARMLGARWGAPVPVGYTGGSGRPITQVVEAAALSGRRVVVASYVMAPGTFYDRLAASGAALVSRPLLDGRSADADLVSLVLDRFGEASQLLGVPSLRGAQDVTQVRH